MDSPQMDPSDPGLAERQTEPLDLIASLLNSIVADLGLDDPKSGKPVFSGLTSFEYFKHFSCFNCSLLNLILQINSIENKRNDYVLIRTIEKPIKIIS